jgi:hypothetical protein
MSVKIKVKMKLSEMMKRARFVDHGSKKILLFDFSDLEKEEAQQVMNYGKQMISHMPNNSVLTLTNVTGLKYDDELKEDFKRFTEHNRPYVVAGAVVGVTGWKKLIYLAALKLSGRTNLQLCSDEVEARKWLERF